MNAITHGCSVTDKKVSGLYDYFLYSRADGYTVILRSTVAGTEWLYRVILQSENVDTIWDGDVTALIYKRPDKMAVQTRKYVATKMKTFNTLSARDIS